MFLILVWFWKRFLISGNLSKLGNCSFKDCSKIELSGFDGLSWTGITFEERVFEGCVALVGNLTLTDCTTVPSTWSGCSPNLKRTYVTTTY